MSASVAEFVTQLAALDVRLWLDDGKLRCDAPQNALTPDMLQTLRQRKQEIIDFLSPRERAPQAAGFDPQDAEIVRDPYPVYSRLREQDPVHKSPIGHWVLTRYRDVREALLNPALTTAPAHYSWLHARHRETSIGAEVANNILPFMDGPGHARSRRLIASTWSNQLRTRMPDLHGIARDVLQPHLAAGRLDLVNEFGRPFATRAICALLGLPQQDEQRIAKWGDTFLLLLTGVQSEQMRADLESALAEFRAFCRGVLQQRKAAPGDDLLSALLAASDEGGRLGDDEIVDTCMLLVGDGIENVASVIGTSVTILLAHPQERAALLADPTHARRIVDECLRYETPGQYIARVATRDLEIGGKAIRQSESVLLMLGAANRDPQAYADAGSFCPARGESRHLSFGRGRHTCLGAQLVPVELQVALEVLFASLQNLRLEQPGQRWRVRPGHRWLEECRVAFDPS